MQDLNSFREYLSNISISYKDIDEIFISDLKDKSYILNIKNYIKNFYLSRDIYLFLYNDDNSEAIYGLAFSHFNNSEIDTHIYFLKVDTKNIDTINEVVYKMSNNVMHINYVNFMEVIDSNMPKYMKDILLFNLNLLVGE